MRATSASAGRIASVELHCNPGPNLPLTSNGATERPLCRPNLDIPCLDTPESSHEAGRGSRARSARAVDLGLARRRRTCADCAVGARPWVAPSYLNKHLQALACAGLLESLPGARGGFRLARSAETITLLDVVEAIDGHQPAFRCTEIRRRGIGEQLPDSCFAAPCAINAAMQSAEAAWRDQLSQHTIASIRSNADEHAPQAAAVSREALGRGQSEGPALLTIRTTSTQSNRS
jgi:Rrf2 family protein